MTRRITALSFGLAAALTVVAAPASTQPAATTGSILSSIPAGQTRTVSMNLRARVGPLTLARGTFSASLSREAYSADATYSTAGIAASFNNDAGTTSARGSVVNAQLRPRTFVNQETNGKRRRVTVAFRPGDVEVTANPMWGDMGSPPATQTQKTQAVDPLTGLMELSLVTGRDGGRPCGGTVRVFDGKRVYDIRTTYVRQTTVSTPAYSGPAAYCRGTYTEVAGFRRREGNDNRDPIRLEMWLADVGGTGISAPVRMTGGRGLVSATLYAESVQVR